MMDMQMLGMMNYISSIMRWQNAGRTTATAAGRSTTEGNSFDQALRQAQVNYLKEQQECARLSIYNMQNPYQNLALLGILSGNYGWNSIL